MINKSDCKKDKKLTRNLIDHSMQENSGNKHFAPDQAEVECNKHFSKIQKLFVSNKDCTQSDPLFTQFWRVKN